jgi:hypothetical protein
MEKGCQPFALILNLLSLNSLFYLVGVSSAESESWLV